MEERSACCAIALTLAAIAGAGCGRGAARQSEVKDLAQRPARSRGLRRRTADAEGKKLWKLTQQFYERQHAPAWINGTVPRATSPSSLRR